MALTAVAVSIATRSLSPLPVKDGTYATPVLATPEPGPVAPPLDTYIPPNPITQPSAYQDRGTGTTPFVVSSGQEKPAIIATIPRPTFDPVLYQAPDATDQQVFNPNMPVPAQEPKPLPPGTKVVMPVPKGQQPTKPPVPPVVDEVPTPGPVKGNIAGFDLSTIPTAGWIAGAVLLVLLLRR